jgi:RNA polymerase sigma-70 factor, ECF subfamily
MPRDSADGADRNKEFEREALPWLDDVYRFARSLTRDDADADDIVQEAFLRAYRSWHTFQRGTDARRWLFTIARNVFLRSRQREARSVAVEDPELETIAAVQMSAALDAAGQRELLARLDLGPAIAQAIDELPDAFRQVVLLVDVEGNSYEDASEMLDIPIGTVRSRLFRGRRLLQQSLLVHARDAGLISAAAVDPVVKGR